MPSEEVASSYAEAVKRKRFAKIYLDQLAELLPAIKTRRGGCLKDILALIEFRKYRTNKGKQPSVRQINAKTGDKGFSRRAKILRQGGILPAGRSRELSVDLDQMANKRWREKQGIGVIKQEWKPPPDPKPYLPAAELAANKQRLSKIKAGLLKTI